MFVGRLGKRLVTWIIDCFRGAYWNGVGFLSVRHPFWPRAQPAREAGEGAEKELSSRNVLVLMHSGRLNDLYAKCIETARHSCPEALIVLFTDFSEAERAILRPFGVVLHDIETTDYARKQNALRIELLKSLDLRFGDHVIVSDIDVIFQSDPFAVFGTEFDVFFTTRHYQYHYAVNSGVWGFRVNERSKRFVTFFIRQVFARSWKSEREFGSRFGRNPYGPGWYVDQDFLCTVYENLGSLPREISGVRFYDAGFKYNFCPSYDIYGEAAVEELKSKLGNPDYVVLHLKGELKHVMDISELDSWNMKSSPSSATKDSGGGS
jgi:hypothetical protein